jgi:hypothetical protein
VLASCATQVMFPRLLCDGRRQRSPGELASQETNSTRHEWFVEANPALTTGEGPAVGRDPNCHIVL